VDKIDQKFFHPEVQAVFWESLKPNLKGFIETCEEKEEWTFKYDESPETFKNIAIVIKELADAFSKNRNIDEAMGETINLLSRLPYGVCMSSLIWMDKASDRSEGISLKIYSQCLKYARDKESVYYKESNNLIERIENIMRFEKKANLFKNGETLIKIRNENSRGIENE